jgi:outer membrane protein TolC
MLCVNSRAQPVVITPDEAVDIAIRNNLSLETSRTSLETKRRASSLSWNQFIPNINVAGTVMRDNEAGVQPSTLIPVIDPSITVIPMEFNGISGSFIPMPSLLFPPSSSGFFKTNPIDLPQWHIAWSLQASLNISIAMFERMNSLKLDYQSGLLSYEKAKIQLERDVRKAYHNMLLLQENIALLRATFENVERQVQTAQANYNAGLVPELTLLRAQVGRENLRPTIDQAENGLKLSMASFAMSLGMDYNTQFNLVPVNENIDIVQFDVAEMITKAAAGNMNVQELRHAILMLQSARKMQVYALFPALSISWNHASAFIKDPWKDSWFESNDNWRNSGSLTIALGLSLNSLIPFSANSQGIKSVEDQIRSLNINLAQAIQGTEIEIYNIILSLERIRTSLEAQSQSLNVAERAYRASEQAYNAGLQDYSQVQNDQQSLHQARVNMLEQQFNYLNGLIDLEYAIGVPFGTLSGRRN